MTVVFDKLAFVHRLESESAFSRGQAEALSEALHTAVNETVATKADLGDVRHEIRELRSELKLWTGSLAAGLFAALSGLAVAMRFLGH
ncbi:MAG: hypothetical protein WBQ75_19985 [Acetobacteraceae bacterium]